MTMLYLCRIIIIKSHTHEKNPTKANKKNNIIKTLVWVVFLDEKSSLYSYLMLSRNTIKNRNLQHSSLNFLTHFLFPYFSSPSKYEVEFPKNYCEQVGEGNIDIDLEVSFWIVFGISDGLKCIITSPISRWLFHKMQYWTAVYSYKTSKLKSGHNFDILRWAGCRNAIHDHPCRIER